MEQVKRIALEREGTVLAFLLLFLGANAFINAFYGFSFPLFVATVPLSAGMAFFFPRAGIVAALLLTIFFERFFTLQSFWIGDTAYKLYPLDILLVAVLVATLLGVVRDRERLLRFRSADGWLIAFFILVTGIFLVSVFGLSDTSPAVAFSTWKNYVFYGLSGLALATYLKTREDIFRLTKLLLVGVAAAGIFLLLGVLRGGGLWTEYTPLSTPGVRLLAFPHAFYFSLAFLSLLLSLSYWWERVTMVHQRLLTLLILVFFVGIVGSLMRHLWLGIAGTIGLALLLSPWIFGRTLTLFLARFVFPAIVVLTGIWYFTALFPGSDTAQMVESNVRIVTERLSSIGSDTDESFAWRGEVWESALQKFSLSPLFGIGFGVSVPVELGGYRQFVEVRNMHNSWLALLIQTGIVGAVLFGLFLVTLMWRLWQRAFADSGTRQIRFVVSGLIIFQGLVFFSQPYLETNLLGLFFWMTLGVARALLEIESSQAKDNQIVSG